MRKHLAYRALVLTFVLILSPPTGTRGGRP
jgi:hypothetical protein